MALVIGDVFRRAAVTHGERVAARFGDRSLTFAALDREGDRLARVLAARGIGLGDRVVWWGDTSLAPLPLFVALARLGAVFAPVNALLGPAEAGAVLARRRRRGARRPARDAGAVAHPARRR
jgi:acyl-CoA synthetase (AMP-forming)/AMP-acid ligase II